MENSYGENSFHDRRDEEPSARKMYRRFPGTGGVSNYETFGEKRGKENFLTYFL